MDMEITISGRHHLEITPAIRQYATDKVIKLPRYYDRIQGVEVIAGRKDSHSHEVEIIVSVERSDPFIAKDSGADLYACIDGAADKMERQLSDHKNKIRDHKH